MNLRTNAPAVVLALLVAGCSASADGVTDPTAPVTPAVTEPAVAAAPDVIGQGLKEARNALEAAGFTVVAIDSLEDRSILMESNWVVTDQATDGDTVNLGAKKSTDGQPDVVVPEPVAEATTEPAAEPTAASVDGTPSGMTFGMATVVCDRAGDANFTYGFDASWTWGGTHVVEGDTMFLKAEVDIENAFGNESEATVECRVSGTEAAPVLDSFEVY